MREDTFFKYASTFDYYLPTVGMDALGATTYSWAFDSNRKCMLIPVSGATFNLVTAQPLMVGGKVSNVKDAAGNDVFPADMFVSTVAAHLNIYGIVTAHVNVIRDKIPAGFNQGQFAQAVINTVKGAL